MSDLRGIKVGDKVWIVPHGATDESVCYHIHVKKVGTRWCRAGTHRIELVTGKSDWLEGRPVMAYRSREEWLERRKAYDQWRSVCQKIARLPSDAAGIKPEFVAALQSVVDQYYPEESHT